ncbi:collagen alpha-2(IX) chain-like [Penaeus monodon]|uniref:collagen alpha-2(IX) chain-like n=1 Tax=Penaeus monodon TaxID=6687 RepID=UPI0018A73C03|nr:collagen alpha-2(IX) chain-like [Penaeus monodon]
MVCQRPLGSHLEGDQGCCTPAAPGLKGGPPTVFSPFGNWGSTCDGSLGFRHFRLGPHALKNFTFFPRPPNPYERLPPTGVPGQALRDNIPKPRVWGQFWVLGPKHFPLRSTKKGIKKHGPPPGKPKGPGKLSGDPILGPRGSGEGRKGTKARGEKRENPGTVGAQEGAKRYGSTFKRGALPTRSYNQKGKPEAGEREQKFDTHTPKGARGRGKANTDRENEGRGQAPKKDLKPKPPATQPGTSGETAPQAGNPGSPGHMGTNGPTPFEGGPF